MEVRAGLGEICTEEKMADVKKRLRKFRTGTRHLRE